MVKFYQSSQGPLPLPNPNDRVNGLNDTASILYALRMTAGILCKEVIDHQPIRRGHRDPQRFKAWKLNLEAKAERYGAMIRAVLGVEPLFADLTLGAAEEKEYYDLFVKECVMWLKAEGLKMLEEKYDELVGNAKGSEKAGGTQVAEDERSGGGVESGDVQDKGDGASVGDDVDCDGA